MTAWIRGKKILLRPMTEKDTENIVRWRNEAFVRENFIYQKPFTAEGHKHWAETMVNTGAVYHLYPGRKAGWQCVSPGY